MEDEVDAMTYGLENSVSCRRSQRLEVLEDLEFSEVCSLVDDFSISCLKKDSNTRFCSVGQNRSLERTGRIRQTDLLSRQIKVGVSAIIFQVDEFISEQCT